MLNVPAPAPEGGLQPFAAVCVDGPAHGQHLALDELPVYLRMMEVGGVWQPVADTAAIFESGGGICIYKLLPPPPPRPSDPRERAKAVGAVEQSPPEGKPAEDKVTTSRQLPTYRRVDHQPSPEVARDGQQWLAWRTQHDIFDTPWQWDFFEALRTIERLYPASARIGTSNTLREDPVRFGQFVSLAFASSTLERQHAETLQKAEDSERLQPPTKLLVRFIGLTGPDGPLPLVLTELIRNRLVGVDDPDLPRTTFGEGSDRPQAARRDPALAEFIDIFHHRIISLFYRAWAVANKAVDFDREELPGTKPAFSDWLASLFGHGLPEYNGLDEIPTWQKVAFTGHLSNGTRHFAGLEGIVAAAFTTPTKAEPLVGHWIKIPTQERCRLGKSRRTGTLGRGCMVGARYWDCEQKFRIRLGPMSYREFRTFLPDGKGRRKLQDWIDNYTRREFSWEAVIVLKRTEVPRLRLGHRLQLSRTAWLTSHLMGQDPDDYRVRSTMD